MKIDHRRHYILVLDTEGYSNTGGQQSKSTPFGASMKFAIGGKEHAKKDLGLIAMMSGAYVAQIALGANQAQAIRAFREAESFDGPSIILAYAPCIAHGFALQNGVEHQQMLVNTGAWPLYRFDPRLALDGHSPPKSLNYWRQYGTKDNKFDMVLINNDNEVICTKGLIEKFTLTNSDYTLRYVE